MSEHLVVDPNQLYRLYSYKDIDGYYSFTFLPEYTSIEIDIFYDILNSISIRKLSSLYMYMFKQWALTHKRIELESVSPVKRKKNILRRNLEGKISSKEELNDKLMNFIKGDKVVGIYIMNQLLKFLYPC